MFAHSLLNIAGANTLASYLIPYAQEVRVVTGFHEVCTEHGEDLTDFFTKYNKTKQDLQKYILATPAFTHEQAREIIGNIYENEVD